MRPFLAVIVAVSLLLGGSSAALEGVRLESGLVEGLPWPLAGASIELSGLGGEYATLDLQLDAPGLPEPLGPLPRLALHCKRFDLVALHCLEGRLHLPSPHLATHGLAAEIPVQFRYLAEVGRFEARLGPAGLGDGRLELQFSGDAAGWRLTGSGERLALAQLLGLAAPWLPPTAADWRLAGRTDLRIAADGRGGELRALSLKATASGLGFSDAAGLHAGEGVVAALQLALHPGESERSGSLELRLERGQLYLDPLFVELDGNRPLRLEIEAAETPAGIEIGRWEIDQPEVIAARGRARLDPGHALQELEMQLEHAELERLYPTYLQPLLAGTAVGDLEGSGGLSGELWLNGGELKRLLLQPHQLHLDDRGGRFGLYGIDGTLGWSGTAEELPTRLSWEGGHLYRADLGPTAIVGHSAAGTFELAEELGLPIMDGWLMMDRFRLEHSAAQGFEWSLNGLLTPISLERFSRAMGWPLLHGRLSGMIPDVEYRDGRLSVGGDLLAKVFDGEVRIRKLSLEHPFGVVPRLAADVRLRRLDLETLTRTFSFGRIEGRLDGEIEGLRLEHWQPAAFDARLHTPADDDSRHRISQRAVDNLSSVGGGGAAGALSRSFLRFFEDFGYRRLGLSCRLRRGVCEMDGVAPAEGGYYIVEGGGIPRIDVIGYARRVDWDELLERLANVDYGEGPVIQ